jgi:Flp pilus assembly pilin Flp
MRGARFASTNRFLKANRRYELAMSRRSSERLATDALARRVLLPSNVVRSQRIKKESTMTNTFKRFWNEQDGAIVSAEIMLIATILVIGVIVGLKSVRDSVVTELADVAQAFANINQSYSYSGVCGHAAFSAGANFSDQTDFCDTFANNFGGQNSKCVNVADAAFGEGWN